MQNVTPFHAGESKMTPETSWCKVLKSHVSAWRAELSGSLSTWWNKWTDGVNPRGHAGHQSPAPCPCNTSTKLSTNSLRRKITDRLSFPQVSWGGGGEGGGTTVTLIKMDDMWRLPPVEQKTQVVCDTVVGDVMCRVTSHFRRSSSRKEEPRSCYGSNRFVPLFFFFNQRGQRNHGSIFICSRKCERKNIAKKYLRT